MSRRNERTIAFQALYSWEVTQSPLEDLLTFSWLTKDDEKVSAETESSEASENDDEKLFAKLLIAGTIEHIDEIDDLIVKRMSSNWTKERLNKVALAVLRTSVYEIVYQKDSNVSIVIDEAISIAKKFGAEDSYKFINAVLDKIGKEVKGTEEKE